VADVSTRRREWRDVNERYVLLFGVALAAFIAIALLALRLIFGLAPSPLPFGFDTGLRGSGQPVLERDPYGTLAAYDKEKRAALDELGWVDRKAGVARIPIADAMQVIAERGIPDWGQHATPAGENDGCRTIAQNVPRAPQNARCYDKPPERAP
jgi:hypothetical protein